MSNIYGLTLWQPWAWLVAQGYKLVENRNWSPPKHALGRYLAIHAGKTNEPGVQSWLREKGLDIIIPANLPAGHIVAVARLSGFVTERTAHQLPAGQRPWFFGPYGWVLENVVAIEPVACPGRQKLWELPTAVLDEVRLRYAEVRTS